MTVTFSSLTVAGNVNGGGSGTATGNGSVGTDTFSGARQIRGSAFNDTLTNTFINSATNQINNLAVTFDGQGGDDVMNTGGGSDVLTGGGGNDTINAGSCPDMAVFTGGVARSSFGATRSRGFGLFLRGCLVSSLCSLLDQALDRGHMDC